MAITLEKLNGRSSLDDFIEYFEAIPASRWCRFVFKDEHGRKCAQGHLGADPLHTPVRVDRLHDLVGLGLASVNNGEHPNYQKGNIKTRVLTFLKDVRDGNW